MAQKLKRPKTCKKRLYDYIKLVLCKKTAAKNNYYSKNDRILKMAKIGHDAWAIAHAKWSVWLKN